MSNLKIRMRSYTKETALGKFLRRKRYNLKLGNRDAAIAAVKIYAPELLNKPNAEDLIEDMIRMSKKFRYGYDEYFLYHFAEKNDAERLEFVADLDRIDIVESLNKAKNQSLFDDKSLTYQKYKKFYFRELQVVDGSLADFIKLKEFLIENKRIILKPADSSCGKGVKILDINKLADIDVAVKAALKDNSRGLIAEELIIQDSRMAKLHPQSVNTVRITTLRMNDRVEILHPFLRIGRGESIVDNGGAGGIFGTIDIDTGMVLHSKNELGQEFTIHPDTKEPIIGFCIPEWEQAKKLAVELAMVTPSNRYSGWDLALTEKGWIMVEGNARGQFVGWQITTGVGFKKEICNLLMEISSKKYTKIVSRLMEGCK